MSIFDIADESQDFGRQLARANELLAELIEHFPFRQLSVNKQIGGFLECRLLRQIVNRIAAVAQLAGLAVDEARARALEVDAFEAPMHPRFTFTTHRLVRSPGLLYPKQPWELSTRPGRQSRERKSAWSCRKGVTSELCRRRRAFAPKGSPSPSSLTELF